MPAWCGLARPCNAFGGVDGAGKSTLVAAIYGTKRYADWMARIVGAVEVRVVRRSMEDHLFQSALAAVAATLPAAADDGGPGKAD